MCFLGTFKSKIDNNKIWTQLAECRSLNGDKIVNLKKNINNGLLLNIAQIKDFFKTPKNNYIFKHLKINEKNAICQKIVEDNDISFISNFIEIRDVFENIVLLELKSISESFKGTKNVSLNEIDFSVELNNDVIANLIGKSQGNVKTCSTDEISKKVLILKSLPIASCSKEIKTTVSLLLLCLYKDLFSANQPQLAEEVVELLLEILHFGEKVVLHKFVTFNVFLNLISPKKYKEFYTMLLNNLKFDMKAGKNFMETIVDHIKKINEEDETYFELLNLSITYLSSPLAPKDLKEYLDCLHIVVWKSVENYFNLEKEKDYDATREYVEKTLPSFCNYFNSFFNKLQQNSEMNENMRKICKIYIGNSVSVILNY